MEDKKRKKDEKRKREASQKVRMVRTSRSTIFNNSWRSYQKK